LLWPYILKCDNASLGPSIVLSATLHACVNKWSAFINSICKCQYFAKTPHFLLKHEWIRVDKQ